MILAQNLQTIQSNAFPGVAFPTSPAALIDLILPYVFSAAGIAVLVYLVTAGLQMMTSKGDPKAMESAKGKMTNAILGIVIMAIAFAIVSIVGKLLGLTAFTTVGF